MSEKALHSREGRQEGSGGKATKAYGLSLNISYEKLSVSELE